MICTIQSKQKKLAIYIMVCIGLLLGNMAQAQSAEFTATIDVDDGVVVGEAATLTWYVTGGPATCTVNHDVGSFAVTADPQAGTIEAIPPLSGEPFLLSCVRGGGGDGDDELATDTVVVIPNPTITFTAQHGTTLVNSLAGGRIFWLDWSADYATECSAMTSVEVSNPSVIQNYALSAYRSGDGDSGRTRYLVDGGVRANVGETTTFYITCSNQEQGTETTEAITITVVDPPPPEPIIIDVIAPVADPASINRDQVRGYGEIDYEFRARNTTYCNNYKAYNVHEYPAVETSLPPGYSAWSGAMHRRIDLRLGTSSVLTVTCGREALDIGGITYPATSTTLVKTFLLSPQSMQDDESETGTSSYASALINVTPAEVESNILTGGAYITSNIVSTNADYCNLYAYRVSDGMPYELADWTRDRNWNRIWSDPTQTIDRTYIPIVSTSTLLTARCVNVYDFYFGTYEEQLAAVVHATTTVTVNKPVDADSEPVVWLYSGPSVHLTADNIWADAETQTNLRLRSYIGRNHIRVDNPDWNSGVAVDTVGSVSFTFNHPHGAGQSDVYNIHLRHCDESDGAANFTVATAGSGEVGSYVSELQYPGQNDRCDSTNEQVVMIAEGVVLADGETIIVTCTAAADTNNGSFDVCAFSDLYIGTGSGDRVVSVPADIDAPENTLIWMSEGATQCHSLDAETADNTNYVWSYSQRTYGSLFDTPINPVTTYSITCERPADNVASTQDVEVITSTDPDAPLAEEETVSDEAVYEIGACWDVAPNPDVLVSNAPTDHVVAPDDLHLIPNTFVLRSSQCVPLVDLSVSPVYRGTNLSTDSVIDIADGVDNVNGTYNLSIVPYVQNLANIDLPQDASIPYRVTLSGGSVSEVNSGFYNQTLPANTPSNVYQLTDDQYDGIQFGTYAVEVRFNMDGTPNYPDSDFSNNRFTDSVVLAVPEPHLTVSLLDGRSVIDNSITTLETPLVRSGFNSDLNWSVNVNYPLDCTLTGPGIGTQNLTLATVGSNNFGNNPSSDQVAISLQSSGEFQLECTEPITGQTFTHTGNIEVVPDFQEL